MLQRIVLKPPLASIPKHSKNPQVTRTRPATSGNYSDNTGEETRVIAMQNEGIAENPEFTGFGDTPACASPSGDAAGT
jgi:hypothetical protein